MNKKINLENINTDELKEKMKEIKTMAAQAKLEKEANDEIEKQTLGQKIGGILILIILLIGTGWAFISNWDLMLLPKNSVTIIVKDEVGANIEGVDIKLHNQDGIYNSILEDVNNLTLLDMEEGNYILTFEEIPEGYKTDTEIDHFTLNKDGKVKLEYILNKK